MPKVSYSASKGLIQETGSGFDIGGSKNSNVLVRSATTAHDLTATGEDLTVVYTGAMDGDITLPQATADNVGMVIKLIFAINDAQNEHQIGFVESGGTTTMVGTVSLCDFDSSAAPDQTALVGSAKVINIDSNANDKAGGGVGSSYIFTYYAAGKVHLVANGVTTGGTPALSSNAESSATGI